MQTIDLNSPENREAIGWCVGEMVYGNLPKDKFFEFHNSGIHDQCYGGNPEAIAIIAKEILREENRRLGCEDSV